PSSTSTSCRGSRVCLGWRCFWSDASPTALYTSVSAKSGAYDKAQFQGWATSSCDSNESHPRGRVRVSIEPHRSSIHGSGSKRRDPLRKREARTLEAARGGEAPGAFAVLPEISLAWNVGTKRKGSTSIVAL